MTSRDDKHDERDQMRRMAALMKAFKSNDASSLEVCNFARDIDFGIVAALLECEPSPCGHSSQYAYSEDGGKRIVCLLCERTRSHARENAQEGCPHGMQTGATPKAPCALCEADRLAASAPPETPQSEDFIYPGHPARTTPSATRPICPFCNPAALYANPNNTRAEGAPATLLKTQRHYAEQHMHDLYKTGDKNAPPSILDRNGEVVLGLCKLCGMGEAELVEPCAPSHVAPNCPYRSYKDHDPANCGHCSSPSTTRQSIETPRTDALRALMGEIYEPDNLALDHMLEKYGELERELAEANAGKVKLTEMLAEEMAASVASATACSKDDVLEEAALVCEARAKDDEYTGGEKAGLHYAAFNIRALKNSPDGTVKP